MTEHFSFTSGCVVQVAKCFKEKWFSVTVAIAALNFVLLLKSFIATVLKCKVCLKTNKCVCVTMCSLVMSSFSRDFKKTEIGYLKYQQCFNLPR